MGLKLTFTQSEVSSKARSVEIPPTGEYQCNIVDVETREVNPGSANEGKPYWNIRFVVQEGKYQGSSIYGKIMLFTGKDGTLSSLSQFLQALNFDVHVGEVEIPHNDELEGRAVTIVGRHVPKGFDKKLNRELNAYFKVIGYKPPMSPTKKASDSSLLP
jgi:hypothetical protein